jgi:hypothetical protein
MTVLNLTWFRTTFLACPRQEKDGQREEKVFPPFDNGGFTLLDKFF